MIVSYNLLLLHFLLALRAISSSYFEKVCKSYSNITNINNVLLDGNHNRKGVIFPLPKVYLTTKSKNAAENSIYVFAQDIKISIIASNEIETKDIAHHQIMESAISRWCHKRSKIAQPDAADIKVGIELRNLVIHVGPLPILTDSQCLSPICSTSRNQTFNNEAYRIDILSETNVINIYTMGMRGCLGALASLSQLFFVPLAAAKSITIIDWPNRRWRGLMLDMSRHFIPPKLIQNTMDAMESSRLNILHLHLTDSQSFPIQLQDVVLANGSVLALSSLARKGAFDSTKTYSLDDLKQIVLYAKDRGIEVIPEIDMPAHALSWGEAFSDVIVRCHRLARSQQTPHNIYPLDPSNPLTFILAEEILKQIVSIFPSKYLHIGGDEVNEQCWHESPELQQWAKDNNITSYKLTKYFEEKIFRIVLYKLKKIPIVWQGILDASNIPESLFDIENTGTVRSRGRALRRLQASSEPLLLFPTETDRSRKITNDKVKVIIEPWKCWGGLAVRASNDAKHSGYPTWMAACLYLDYNSDWTTFLMTDLLSQADSPPLISPSTAAVNDIIKTTHYGKNSTFQIQPLQHEDYFLGGEGAMWTECVDHTNFECRVWPRAGAIAQSLWGFLPNDCVSLSLNCSSSDSELDNVMWKPSPYRGTLNSDSLPLTVPYTKLLYSSYVLFRYYLTHSLQISAAQLIFHYPERASNSNDGRARVPSGLTGSTRNPSYANTFSSVRNIEPIYPKNLSRALQLIDALEAGITVTTSGPRIVASLPPSATHRSGHQMWISSQCLGIPEAIQRPLTTPGISLVQLNIADGSIGARRDQMLAWLQKKAQQGVHVVGFCELVGWNTLHSKTELVKNVPLLTLRAANAGFVHSYVSKTSPGNTYPVGLVSVYPFHVLHEWRAPDLQRCAVHVFISKLQLHVFVAHLHAHDATLRSEEASFLVKQMQPLLDANEKVVLMGDLNTLSPYDRAHHDEENLVTLLQREDDPVFPRLRKKFLTPDSKFVDYRTIQHFLNAGLKDVCVEFCCQEQKQFCPRFVPTPILDSPDNKQSYDAARTLAQYQTQQLPQWSFASNGSSNEAFNACMRKHCSGSEPTQFNPEWPNVGVIHPRIRLDYIFMNQAALGSENAILTAGIETNNVTDLLSDHYPAHVTWQDKITYPQGVELFGV